MDMSGQVFGRLIENERDYLYRFALTRLRNPVEAEEAVQETLLAGLEAGARFEGKSTLRTWLTAILKFKIIDTHRRKSREPLFAEKYDDVNDGHSDTLVDDLREQAAAWGDPEQALQQKRFLLLLENCLSQLPPATARAFYLREIEGADTDAICKELCISPSNCWVMLHRARAMLRADLEQRWISPTKPGKKVETKFPHSSRNSSMQ
jgi:RNA polymerase sigma-70 factor, ECF subfamily